ncbi:crotonase/enoyl-CoA hydratase family protein [Albimonas sp. CAU 1670]|uniref:crotonase/enoyl-CoA hydratase family protein n=1 Tax=Albimonas sp. CAU 1670 TaxID=3032599 RepID=UPI0023DB5F24|nr:crotonase/enoyl-CoA hydratase family protein [Albimonas sp. CAU 1670]MDF2235229.1 crotonase/enoyl-CoA hydratase family protein [Albimonas sp. CAU 1670]
MSYATLRYEVEENIATVTLNRPEMLNAFTVEMAGEILAVLDRADADPEVRAVIFTGEGRAFCAGMDLSSEGNVFGLDESVDASDPAGMERNRDTGGTITLRIFRMKKPVIAAINGAGVGIGATMTLPMDARICSTKARIGFVFAKIGVCMEACSSWFLPRLVGMQTALDWAMSAEILTADKLLAAGFCTRVVAPEDLMAEARATARRYIDGLSPVSVAVNRQLLWRMAGAAHPMEAHKLDSRVIYELSTADGKEGVTSFIEKRPAAFTKTPPDGMPASVDWDAEPGWG